MTREQIEADLAELKSRKEKCPVCGGGKCSNCDIHLAREELTALRRDAQALVDRIKETYSGEYRNTLDGVIAQLERTLAGMKEKR